MVKRGIALGVVEGKREPFGADPQGEVVMSCPVRVKKGVVHVLLVMICFAMYRISLTFVLQK